VLAAGGAWSVTGPNSTGGPVGNGPVRVALAARLDHDVDVDVPSSVLDWRAGEYDEVAYAEGEQALTLDKPFPVTVAPADPVRM
jgi:hypothetical protein